MASQDNAHYFGVIIVPKEVIVNLLYFKGYFNFCTAINVNKKEMLIDSKMCNLKQALAVVTKQVFSEVGFQ